MKPKATQLSETTRAGKQLASITIEFALEDLPEALRGLDVSDLNEAQIKHSLDSAYALRAIREAEDRAAAKAAAAAAADKPAEAPAEGQNAE